MISKMKLMVASLSMLLLVMCPGVTLAGDNNITDAVLFIKGEKYLGPEGYTSSVSNLNIFFRDTDHNVIHFASGKYLNTTDYKTFTTSLNPQSLTQLATHDTYVFDNLPIPATKVGDHYYATFYSPFTLTLVGGSVAYYPHIDEKTGDIIIDDAHCSTVINPGEGVILVAESEKNLDSTPFGICFAAMIMGEKVEFSSDLTGTFPTIENPGNTLVFGVADGELGFYKFTGETLHGLKAYLDNSKGKVSNGRLRYVQDNTTAITDIKEETQSATVYSLTGQRVSSSYKGLVIKNGKKVINK